MVRDGLPSEGMSSLPLIAELKTGSLMPGGRLPGTPIRTERTVDRGRNQEEVWSFPDSNGTLPREARGQPLTSHSCQLFAMGFPAWEVGRTFWAG